MIKQMPKVAFGTWMIQNPEDIKAVIPAALETGYKHIDTAQLYFNEEFIGEALKNSGFKREDYWLTTKVWVHNFRHHAYESVEWSLKRLQTDYVDTMLLHAMASKEDTIHAYKELMRAREDGLIRFIGVSNFSIEMLEAIKEATGEFPMYNQIIASVKQRITELEEFCKANGITLMGYSSIRPYYEPNNYYSEAGLTDEEKKVVDGIADKHNTSPAMILIKWAYDHDYVVLPKSTKVERVKSNFKLLDVKLDKEDMETLDKLNAYTYAKWQGEMNKWAANIPNDEQFKTGVRIGEESDKAFMSQ